MFGRRNQNPSKSVEDRGDDFASPYVELFPGGMMHPHIAPFDNSRIAPQMIDTVDPLTGLKSPIDGHIPSVQNADTDLAFLRSVYPFVPIVPFPQSTRSFQLVQNVPTNIDVSNFSLARFKGNGDYFVSAQGAASAPLVANQGDAEDQNSSIYKPEDSYFYIGGVKQLSVFSYSVGVVVSIMLYTTNNRPQVY